MSEPPWSAGAAALLGDAELIERILAGERELFQALVQRYQDSLYRVALSLSLDDDVAADLVQDAFVRAYANLARCHDRRRFRFWLLATLRNRALDWLKEKRRRDASLSEEAVVRKVESSSVGQADLGERLVVRRALEAAMAKLSPQLREAFVLRHLEQCTVEEVAELLGIGVSAVKMRLHRARQQMQELLTAEGDRAEDVTDRGAGSSLD